MIPVITAFAQSPDRGRGLARDMPVRWALEETGQLYDVRLVTFAALKERRHRRLNPFGQIPTFEEGGSAIFESAAIVLHIAELHAGLLPEDRDARSRAIAWMFAAVGTVEPPILHLEMAGFDEHDKPWFGERLPVLESRIGMRLGELSDQLGDADWLAGPFSAGDLLMVTVLRRLSGSDLLDSYSNLTAYVARGEARPAFKRAFDAQLAVFTAASNADRGD